MTEIFIFAGIMDLVFVLFLVGFFLNKDHPYLQNRRWGFTVLFSLMGLWHWNAMAADLHAQENGYTVNCNGIIWSAVLFVPMFFLVRPLVFFLLILFFVCFPLV